MGLAWVPQSWLAPAWAMTPATSLDTTLAQSPPASNPTPGTIAVPDTLRQRIQAWDTAASNEDLEQLLGYYGETFVDGDGIDRTQLRTLLQSFWDRYGNLTYHTQILAAQQTATGWDVEALIHISGDELVQGRRLSLTSTIRCQQHWQNNQLVGQTVVTEQNQITSGQNPPTLTMNLPDEVAVNSTFNLDVIIAEPLDEDLVVGALIDEPVALETLNNPKVAEFEPLNSGGLFKIGHAPDRPEQRWISAVVIRQGGMTLVTQRLRIVESLSPNTTP